TVGHMLTELFLDSLDVDEERRRQLGANAEAFGLGLQLTNILKDITDDRERAMSFIPRDVCDAAGVPLSDLLVADRRHAAHAALKPVFGRANDALDGAFAYCLALPPEAKDVRLFCLLPRWMAVAPLEPARGNDAQFEPDQPVKIDRGTVAEVIRVCTSIAADDDALREGYMALRGGITPETGRRP
ncbi:MAG: squalene/phytoene synthase family protein, partial [Myxococcota bacterium]|nr:squalene/phytoene synthase family protein [Myxococcota bacterium]